MNISCVLLGLSAMLCKQVLTFYQIIICCIEICIIFRELCLNAKRKISQLDTKLFEFFHLKPVNEFSEFNEFRLDTTYI